MQPARALDDEPAGEGDRVTPLDRHAVAPALVETDGTPVEHVDRRNHFEGLLAATVDVT